MPSESKPGPKLALEAGTLSIVGKVNLCYYPIPHRMTRYLCSQLVRYTTNGREKWANLEEIWETGAILDCEEEVAPDGAATFFADDVSFTGRIAKVDKNRFGWR